MNMSVSLDISKDMEERKYAFNGNTILQPRGKIPKNGDNFEITTAQKMMSACLGSLVTSLVVTPFDVVRIRIQQQEILNVNKVCCHVPKGDGQAAELFWMENYCKGAQDCSRITSTFQGFSTISRNEGIFTLWRGLLLTLFMAIPSNIIYFTGYEYIKDNSPFQGYSINPLICGSVARLTAATSVAPMELIKTRLQSIPAEQKHSKLMSHLVTDLFTTTRRSGIGALFTGLQITLWRDVPFSGIYWSFYELFKSSIGNHLKADFLSSPNSNVLQWEVLATSFLSGSFAGTIATFFTHPFDVGKTRLQITNDHTNRLGSEPKRSMFRFLANIYKEEGIKALYSGITPRVFKIAPSCAIMISSYEIGKKFFRAFNN